MKNEAEKRYKELFPTDAEKAKAFDKIAEKYYFSNFGSTSKADLDLLLFSIYIEQILDNSAENFFSYSDYRLSKLLGITQSRISNLKVKKELIYPYEDFNWKKSLAAISKNAVYEDNKIKLFIPDKNLFLEIKNAVEESGGFIEVQLTSNLLQVRLPYFIDLLLSLEDKENSDNIREKMISKVKTITRGKDKDYEIMEKKSFGMILKDEAPNMVIDLISSMVPMLGESVGALAKTIFNIIKESRK